MEICRVCMSSSVSLVDIFSDRPLPDDQFSLADMLNELVDFKVKRDDKLPQKICVTCGLNAQTAFRFQRRFQQSHQLLCMKAVESDNSMLETESSDESKAEPEPREKSPFPMNSGNVVHKPRHKGSSTEMIDEDDSFKNELDYSDDDLSVHSDKTVHSHRYPLRPLKRKSYFQEPTCSSKSLEQSNSSKRSIVRQFKCDQCRSTFATQANLDRHKPNHSGESTVFQCFQCKATFSSKMRMLKHACAKNKFCPHICSHCQMGFRSKSDLSMHLYTHILKHSGAKSYKCNFF